MNETQMIGKERAKSKTIQRVAKIANDEIYKNQARREAMAATSKAGTPGAAPVLSIGAGAIPPKSSAAFVASKVPKAKRTIM